MILKPFYFFGTIFSSRIRKIAVQQPYLFIKVIFFNCFFKYLNNYYIKIMFLFIRNFQSKCCNKHPFNQNAVIGIPKALLNSIGVVITQFGLMEN